MPVRRGFIIAELIAALALLAALLAISLQLVSVARVNRQAIDQRGLALVVMGNCLERLAATSWDDLPAAARAAEILPPSVAAQLPGAALHVELIAPSEEPNARRISATLTWEGTGGRPADPLRVTTWRYRIAEK